MDNSNYPSARTYTVEVPTIKAGERLDKVLADGLAGNDISRARIQALLADGRVELAGDESGGGSFESRHKVKAGDVYLVHVPEPEAAIPKAEDIALDVVFENDNLIVIDKPPGLVVHPGAGNPDGTLVNALLFHCKNSLSGIGGVLRPGIVHRLDKGTGGLMVAAKNDATHHLLSNQFADRSIDRAYYALVWGVPMPREGYIEGNIARSNRNRKKMAVVKTGGKPAKTHYRVIRSYGDVAALVECRLETGRTHQIRVHMTSIGHPVMGDPVYGGGDSARLARLPEPAKAAVDKLGHQALYAYKLGFLPQIGEERLLFEKEKPSFINEIHCELEII